MANGSGRSGITARRGQGPVVYFFYGTLLDGDVRAAILGPAARHLTGRPARLAGYRPVYAPGRTYPVLCADPGGETPGMLFAGITPSWGARLRHFEGAGYMECRVTVVVETGARQTAWTFMPRIAPRGGRDWRLAAWHQRHKRAFIREIRGA